MVTFKAVLCEDVENIVCSVFSGDFAITERSEIGMYAVPMFITLLGFVSIEPGMYAVCDVYVYSVVVW